MAVASPARTVALHLLGRQRRREGRARDLLRGAHEMASLGTKGRALATRLVLGVNVAAGELDRRVDAYVSHASGLEPRVRDALRLAAFETLYLDTPRQVAVSQGVELVRSVAPRAARMANAVLRRISECRGEVDAARAAVASAARGDAGADAGVQALCVASGYPSWLVERLLGEVGPQACAAMCACALEPAPVYVAAAREGLEGRLADRLSRAGLQPTPTGIPGSWCLEAPGALASSGLVSDCEVAVCDLAAQLVCRIAARGAGRILEVGQGRGTKSLLLAAAGRELAGSGDELRISGVDVVASKVRVASSRMRDAGVAGIVSCTEFDARRLSDEVALPHELAGAFDSVLVDAPCSGTGTMRRHPETPWALAASALDPDAPAGLPALQLGMLRAAATRVAPGGTLAYATCSVMGAENEDVVRAFLSSEEGRTFERADILAAPGVKSLPEVARAVVAARISASGSFQSVPEPGSFDGHFCALLRRAS